MDWNLRPVLYVLTDNDEAHIFAPVGKAHQVMVRNRDWYAARAKAIKHAIAQNYPRIVIVCGSVNLYHRGHWNGLGHRTNVHMCDTIWKHNLWVYLDRLMNRWNHVYVPPLSAMRPWRDDQNTKPQKWSYINSPVIPLVAGYTMRALTSLRNSQLEMPFGICLCHQGFDSFTVSDYFFKDTDEHWKLDESGSIGTWSKAYESAILRAIG